jgi:maltooligosyltrehalose trehalohydrolase
MLVGTLCPRRLPVGAELVPDGVHLRVWAGRNDWVQVEWYDPQDPTSIECYELLPEGDGYFSGIVPGMTAGALYAFRLSGRPERLADPAARFQPQGPLGPSEVIDPGAFAWSDAAWPGVSAEGQVLYEMHVGTFTPEGTFRAAAEQLGELARLGITVIEMMPVAEFLGRFGWGYDGVNLFAPTRLYGRPDDVRYFVDRAHAAGIGVILDVVYNHLGPGGHLEQFSGDYFSERHRTDWGKALNFDGPGSGPVREYFLANAGYWIEEFHFDGLRIDATQNIYDNSDDPIVAAIVRRVRAAAGGRATLLVGENEPQDSRLIRAQDQGGYGLDALWNDDFHHAAHVVLSGRHEAYYTDYRGTPQEFVSAAKYGFLYQGQWYSWQKKRRGSPALDLRASAFVNYLENHDQIANSLRGQRCHELTSPGRYRAMTALLLLSPGTPLLFQGQEFACSSPFCYFADPPPDLVDGVHRGRIEFLAQFPSIARAETRALLPDPAEWETFAACKLDFSERETHCEIYALHCDLLRLRREELPHRRNHVDGAVLGPQAFVLRFLAPAGDDRLLVVNFGLDLCLEPAPEPLLASPWEKQWRVMWSSENPTYGGGGTPPVETDGTWNIPGESALFFGPAQRGDV